MCLSSYQVIQAVDGSAHICLIVVLPLRPPVATPTVCVFFDCSQPHDKSVCELNINNSIGSRNLEFPLPALSNEMLAIDQIHNTVFYLVQVLGEQGCVVVDVFHQHGEVGLTLVPGV